MVVLRHLYSIFILPLLVTMVIPLTILIKAIYRDTRLDLLNENAIFAIILGATLLVLGFVLLISSIRALTDVGDDYEPWDPSKYLVMDGPYAYVRNPLTLACLMILLGEVCLTGSHGVAIFAGIYLYGWNRLPPRVYIVSFEEPDLVRRFGGAYREYADHVHRWFPRRRAWNPIRRLYS